MDLVNLETSAKLAIFITSKTGGAKSSDYTRNKTRITQGDENPRL